jgi:hypothetical protein
MLQSWLALAYAEPNFVKDVGVWVDVPITVLQVAITKWAMQSHLYSSSYVYFSVHKDIKEDVDILAVWLSELCDLWVILKALSLWALISKSVGNVPYFLQVCLAFMSRMLAGTDFAELMWSSMSGTIIMWPPHGVILKTP